MFNNMSKMVFLTIMMSGTMLSVSSSSWLSAWMGLEINLLAFIPLVTACNNILASEAALKYFLTQTLASSILLMSIVISSTQYMMVYEMNNESTMLMMIPLMLKMGMAPFHWWFPGVMEGLSWMNSFILMSWQKIAPFMLMSLSMMNSINLILMPIVLSATLGSLMGLNQTSLSKIMAFSSINHMSWMMAAMKSSEPLWLVYFSIYSILTLNVVMMFKFMKLNYISQLFSSTFGSKTVKFYMFMNMLSLGGLPPFLGFMPKWLVIQNLVMNNNMMLMIMLTTMSLITLFFYMRMGYSAMMINHHETSWNYTEQYNNTVMMLLMITSYMSNLGLLYSSLMFMLL
nr:NADH dehydrogenase subunit 2 [Clephydroneura sp.]